MIEEWREIDGYEGGYQVSSLGRVRGVDRFIAHPQCTSGLKAWKGKILRLNTRKIDGYVTVNLSANGRARTEKLHRLVATAFHGPRDLPYEPDHLNGDRADNRSVNLVWKLPGANKRNRTVSTGSSGVVGVFPNESVARPWRSYVTVDYKKHYVGAFATIEEASLARENFVKGLAA